MATGDNILTAISVAKECSMVPSEKEVFIGDVEVEEGIESVKWRSILAPERKLDGKTLEPRVHIPKKEPV
eukprot:CAMPEP_0202973236 /NCGR_PEP_ID=MMETSP1396-20130829/47938_1 /ASSEMBLY_ACC=CAM_ASM_000872 /TAXON_ID= /ORGANISM="Pseudokeronopsis sp., Strain Brazil" /LENGTH=69 /DNA_ID=CAMNT_0049704917 /DNA_START=95 /DNA_END=300 /DNA_ORIENTATION=-